MGTMDSVNRTLSQARPWCVLILTKMVKVVLFFLNEIKLCIMSFNTETFAFTMDPWH